jgi:hypothetical protein
MHEMLNEERCHSTFHVDSDTQPFDSTKVNIENETNEKDTLEHRSIKKCHQNQRKLDDIIKPYNKRLCV